MLEKAKGQRVSNLSFTATAIDTKSDTIMTLRFRTKLVEVGRETHAHAKAESERPKTAHADFRFSRQFHSLKNTKELHNLINYLDRNSSCIPCYALRKKLGLRVSSNPVEKANDVLVSNRQKHNGMSWSTDGSTSLATLTALRRNCEDGNWLLHHAIGFQFDAATQKPAA